MTRWRRCPDHLATLFIVPLDVRFPRAFPCDDCDARALFRLPRLHPGMGRLDTGYFGQMNPWPLGLGKQPTDCGSSCFGSHSTTSGKSTVKPMVKKKTT